MSYDIQAACDAANRRLARTLERSIGQHKRAIRAGFAKAGAEFEPVTASVSAPAQRRIPMISEGTASAQRIQYGRVMFEACAASDCDPIRGECLGHCMGALE